MIGSIIIGTGMYVPEFVLDNKMFASMIETNDEWIVSRTGIKERRIEQEKFTYEMIGEACLMALENAKLKPEEIDMIIVSTITPDYNYPSVACLTQNYIKAINAASFDVSAACAGFVYALDTADLYIKSGRAKNILVAAGDVLTRTVNYFDRGNCVLFGDGAGAAVLSAKEVSNNLSEQTGIIASYLKCECDGEKPFFVKSQNYTPRKLFKEVDEKNNNKVFLGNSERLANNFIEQNGREVMQFVSRALPKSLEEVAKIANLSVDDFDCIIVHQANKRIIEHVIEKYKLNPNKVPINIEKYGNTSSSTVAILLHELYSAGKFKSGDLIALAGFGSGLAYGAMVVRW